jgi:hypothetical protein
VIFRCVSEKRERARARERKREVSCSGFALLRLTKRLAVSAAEGANVELHYVGVTVRTKI